jgi:hypothetical protein
MISKFGGDQTGVLPLLNKVGQSALKRASALALAGASSVALMTAVAAVPAHADGGQGSGFVGNSGGFGGVDSLLGAGGVGGAPRNGDNT